MEPEEKKKHLLKVIVGSKAHGLANKDSDTDYRGVFIVPTTRFLKVHQDKVKETSWIEGDDDNTSWEFGHFMNMATYCNPTILETFLAPRVDLPEHKPKTGYLDAEPFYEEPYTIGDDLKAMFPYVWNSLRVKEAFIGYGINQRKKFFDNKDNRAPKYAVAYLRVLYQAWELLSTGTFSISFAKTPIYKTLKKWKTGNFTPGEVIQKCWEQETMVLDAYNKNPNKKTDLDKVNEFVLKIRYKYWDW